MTDSEIIKALECCQGRNGWGDPKCYECPFDGSNPNIGCRKHLLNKTVDLINRQKAWIEKLDKENEEQHQAILIALRRMGEIRAEAIKEFAERLKESKYLSSEWSHGEHPYVVEEDNIDDLVEEMTEGSE